ARGCVAADHALAFSRARSTALKGADLALVIGVPMDFRLGFGGSFGEHTEIVQIEPAEPDREPPRAVAEQLFGGLPATLAALCDAALGEGGSPERTSEWLHTLHAKEAEKRAAEETDLNDPRAPLHPLRVYKELQDVLDRDAIVI